MSRNRGHRYGAAHKQIRRHFLGRMAKGEVFYCWRPSCRTPGVPVDPRFWDLGHVDRELRHLFGARSPEHPGCNRATITHLKQKAAAAEGAAREPEALRPGVSSREW